MRLVVRLAEAVDDLQALGVLQLLLHRVLVAHLDAQLLGELLDVDALEQLLDGLGAHLRAELVAEVLARLPELFLVEDLVLLQIALARIDDDVALEVEDAFEIAERDVQQVADAARQPFEEPHVADRRRERDVPETLAAHLRLRHLDAALVADHAAVLHPLVLAAEALPVGDRAEDLRAEQSVTFRLERPVVDRFGLGHLAEGPRKDFFRRGERDADRVEIGAERRLAIVKTWSHRCFQKPRRSRWSRRKPIFASCSSCSSWLKSTPIPAPERALHHSQGAAPSASSSSKSTRRRDRATAARE